MIDYQQLPLLCRYVTYHVCCFLDRIKLGTDFFFLELKACLNDLMSECEQGQSWNSCGRRREPSECVSEPSGKLSAAGVAEEPFVKWCPSL